MNLIEKIKQVRSDVIDLYGFTCDPNPKKETSDLMTKIDNEIDEIMLYLLKGETKK